METPGADLILRRKATVGRRSHEARGMPPTKALRLALARAAEREIGVAVSVQGIRQEEIDQQSLVDGLEDAQLFLMIDGPDDAQGAIIVDADAMSALIEAQVLGRVLDRQTVARSPTPTDAAMIAPTVDALLEDFGTNLAEDPDAWWSRGYRYGHMVEDRRALGLLLATGLFRSFRMNVEFEGGAKTGIIQLVLPVLDEPPQAMDADVEPVPHVSFEDQLCHVPVELTAVVDRVRLSLEQADRIEVGSLLPLSHAALRSVRLRGPDGRDVALGSLGSAEGHLAVRLSMPAGQKSLAKAEIEVSDTPDAAATNRKKAKPPATNSVEKTPGASPQSASDALVELPELPPLSLEDDDALDNLFPLEERAAT